MLWLPFGSKPTLGGEGENKEIFGGKSEREKDSEAINKNIPASDSIISNIFYYHLSVKIYGSLTYHALYILDALSTLGITHRSVFRCEPKSSAIAVFLCYTRVAEKYVGV